MWQHYIQNAGQQIIILVEGEQHAVRVEFMHIHHFCIMFDVLFSAEKFMEVPTFHGACTT